LLYLPNCPQYLVATLGSFQAGVAVSPVNPPYKRREHEAVADAAVVDRDNDRRNEVPVAYVAAAPDTEPSEALAEAVRQFALDRVAESKPARSTSSRNSRGRPAGRSRSTSWRSGRTGREGAVGVSARPTAHPNAQMSSRAMVRRCISSVPSKMRSTRVPR
jgi:acyl-CoA synthetase (AMP-forming)/AMP-acid ligase II